MSAALELEPTSDPRRWAALAFIALAQLMIALDATIVSIALPSAQSALHASDADRQWVVTAYTLAFGGLLLVGGKIADQLGRKRAFLIGLAGFALASVAGGAAPSFGALIAARAAQGAFAALLAPTALSLLATSFTEPRERATAFAVYGSIAGSGAALGMLLGGALTQYFSWRWCLYVNLPIAVAAAMGGASVLPSSIARRASGYDLPGVLLVVGGLVALVYSTTQAKFVVASAVLLALFVLRELRTAQPLLPPPVVLDRNRGGAYLAVGLAIAGMFGAYLFLTYYLQVVLRFTPLQAGLAFLPITVASQAGSWLIARRFLPRVSPRALMAPGALIAAAGLALLTQLHTGSGYLTLVLPAELLLGLGLSTAMVPAFSTATFG
ncbi:MAG TPA: MFS transporter, partial [Candidatus Dormibacteraeota bacterium]|nr:MFS transporter [Candidatus Dormibacteraeota bacterium]